MIEFPTDPADLINKTKIYKDSTSSPKQGGTKQIMVRNNLLQEFHLN
jgi:hypothetical protein